MALVQSLVSSDKYGVKCPYAMTPKGICVHNTANDASAKNEIAYMKSNNNEVSFHVAIDDVEAIQVIPFNRNAWAAGDGGNGNGNRNYIHIEICYSKSGGDRFTKAEQRAAKEIASLLKQFGWGIANVKKHQDFSGKYCPHRTLDMGWQRFVNMISVELNGATQSTPSTSTTTEMYRIRKTWSDVSSQKGAFSNKDNAIAECKKYSGYCVFDSKGNQVYPATTSSTTTSTIYRVKDSKGTQLGAFSVLDNAKSLAQSKQAIVYDANGNTVVSYVPVISTTDEVRRYAETGIFYPNCTINFRNAPNVSSSNPVQGQYFKGESVKYDIVVIGNRYNWISWIGASGTRRYMPIKDKQTGESWGKAV